MPSTAVLRLQIEHSLERRFPAALTPVPRTIRETAPTGIPAVDRLLEGGLPIGAISEITGPMSSGRTSLALAFLAARTQEDRVCAWVDAHDAFDSESAAANGVALRQLLWVRCKDRGPQRQVLVAGVEDRGPQRQVLVAGVEDGGPQRQVVVAGVVKAPNPTAKPWARLDQALSATDLLLQAGGFAAIVLDLASTAPEHACRIPLATWFRFRQAADRTRCSLLVLAQQPLAQSSAAVVLDCTRQIEEAPSQTVLAGFTYQVRSGRQRFTPYLAGQRKLPASTWSATTAAQREATA
ncbi:MAG: recombinase RecA [Terracidiphilus sp.]|jgi:hypothetical protein